MSCRGRMYVERDLDGKLESGKEDKWMGEEKGKETGVKQCKNT